MDGPDQNTKTPRGRPIHVQLPRRGKWILPRLRFKGISRSSLWIPLRGSSDLVPFLLLQPLRSISFQSSGFLPLEVRNPGNFQFAGCFCWWVSVIMIFLLVVSVWPSLESLEFCANLIALCFADVGLEGMRLFCSVSRRLECLMKFQRIFVIFLCVLVHPVKEVVILIPAFDWIGSFLSSLEY